MSQIQISSHRKQAGVTSLFIVIFAALLLSVITMSFAQLMNRELQRSSDDELSQSAYDSAMAGVEDAKRVIMLANSGDLTAQGAIADEKCNTVAVAGVAGSPTEDETVIQSSSAVGDELNQAYTCVIIKLNSENYEGSIGQPMRSELVPLKAEGSFNRIKLEWHLTSLSDELDPSCDQSDPAITDLCVAEGLGGWGAQDSVPALLRAQLITPDSPISYSTLDSAAGGTTAFLYPKYLSGSGVDFPMGGLKRYVNALADDSGTPGSINQVSPEVCVPDDVTLGGYSNTYRCEATLGLSPGIDAGSEVSFLRLTPIYNATSFAVTLYQDSNLVRFDGVQPVVDSTGRANDLFRRVEARLSLTSDTQYPEFAIDTNGDLCKNFYVYQGGAGSPGSCTP